MVRDDVYRGGGTFEVMAPVPECFKDGQKLLIMGVVVQLWSSQSPGVVCNQMDFSICAGNRQNASDSVVRGISFNNDRGVQNKMGKDRHSGEGMFESIERMSTVLGEIPRSILPGEPGEGNHNVGVIEYETSVEVGEAQEGLDVLYLTRFRPVQDGLDFVQGHR